MKDTVKVEFEVGGMPMSFESGVLAQQAAGAVSCQFGGNVVFSAVTAAKEPREGCDFFPLQVEYREKFYAAGRFPGGYFKRESRPSEQEILTARVTDRPIRTLFPEGFYCEVQINNMLMASDCTRECDFLSINASSAALMLTDLPFGGPIGGVRIARINGEFVVNPTHDDMLKSDLDLTYVGTADKTMMIEGSAEEISEADFIAAMKTAHEAIQPIIAAQFELRKQLGLPEWKVELPAKDTTLLDKAREIGADKLSDILIEGDKLKRQNAVNGLKAEIKEQMVELFPEMTEDEYFHAFHELEIEVTRENVLTKKMRIGKRGFDKIRELKAQVGILPRVHGSAIFNRGETQALATVTLGPKKDSQSMDAVTGGPNEKSFMLHYNFPPYSVGECGRLGFTGRREIGHGNLAERSLVPILPKDYPYAVRVVSEIMGSNGSSSMASACVGTLALMDAGVPIKAPVAGISVGLFTKGEQSDLVIDILGTEDHCGDMDFKVVGTREGITSFQVDLKIPGLNWDQVTGAFEMARKGRLEILDFMQTVIDAPRSEMSEHAPRVEMIKIDPEKIGALIGPGGKVIRGITETYGVQIDVEEDGTVSIFSNDGIAMKGALKEVNGITAEAEIGKLYEGTVKTIRDFGAFVEVLPGKDGLVHISELADFRVGKVEDICKEGDTMWVKVLDVDRDGKIRLSRKAAMAEMDAEANEEETGE
ncbi:polyribonucleotide nucleotidyltransferase [Tichowtungia aerotolerans]|uniref:Polyribonucleotide nucleotidyltransferase n=1 Tax=Tichowtungia aerotolerans TaxID=2697043 RepID=A0A6P1MDU1_9BACT|nr:polyribonucleotide nucleotidyltransferase [Tichowtungia aerotolerans]QHI69265.1 polyribonucleotide nucleotidyltransferase [Tichowtungia aerotolerans]